VPNEDLGRPAAHLALRDVYGGQRDRCVACHFDVIVAHDRNILGHAEAKLSERANQTQCNEVIIAGDRGRTVIRTIAEVLETGVVAILEARAGMYDVVVVEDEPLSAERAAHTLDALVAVHGVARSGEVNDALVPPL